MKKDVIYIDTEDDITSIIEKVKSSHEKIVALVPPKRVGVLQSAVNLKLLHKAASSGNKHLVLITADKSLAALAAGVQIPVAKNLQSRPELAHTAEPPHDEADDVINGDEMPVGELARTAPSPGPDDEEIVLPSSFSDPTSATSPVGGAKNKKKIGPKVPNFNLFRKKILLIGIGALFLLAFIVWAVVFAPHATVNISAKTTEVPVDFATTLNPAGTTNPAQNVIKPATQQIKKTNALDFDATGKRDVGTKASGVVIIYNCSQFDKLGDISRTVPAGTGISSDGNTFITQTAVTVEPSGFTGNNCKNDKPSSSISVAAQDVGEQYNLKKGSVFTVANQGSGMSAVSQNAFAGGSKRQITVISDGDVAAVRQKLATQDQDVIKKQLTDAFDGKKQIIITESFNVAPAEPSISPAVGSEASKGHITQEITYTLQALGKNDTSKVIKAYVQANTIKSEKDQQVYDDGLGKLKLSKFTPTPSGSTVQLTTNTQVGPKIDAEKLKPQLTNKNYEEIRQYVQKIDGVEDVDTSFSPFWVNKISDQKKISVKFSVSRK